MDELIFTRRRRQKSDIAGQAVIRVSNAQYNKLLEVADETGLSIKEVADRMIEYAFEHVKYVLEDETEGV